MILIVTNQFDITTDLVVLRLQERGIPYVRFNTECFPSSVTLSWRMDGSGQCSDLFFPELNVPIDSVTAVWFRRPVTPVPAQTVADPDARTFVIQESEAYLRNLWDALPGLWVSRPEAIRRATQKLGQIITARSLGFDVPDTIVTCDPETVQTFYQTHDRMIAKPMGRGYVDELDGGRSLVMTNLIGKQDLNDLASVILCPTLFQQYIPKAFDLRVTVVGQRVFATEIHGAHDPTAIVDWRRGDVNQLPHVPHQLPDQLSDRIRRLLEFYGLQFGALDFAVTEDGQYFFLEINPNGQWGWIEQIVGTPIADAVVDLLTGEAEPL